jgi:hypothetical protein
MIGWWTFTNVYMRTTDTTGNYKNMAIGHSCSTAPSGWTDCDGRNSFGLAILWDNNSVSVISTPNIPLQVSGANGGDPPEIDVSKIFSETSGYITKCCNRIYYKLKITIGKFKWWQPPSGMPGCRWWHNGWWGLPETLTVHLWVSDPVKMDAVGIYPDPDENGMFKVIEQELPLVINHGSIYCIWDETNNQCINMVGCNGCGPWSCFVGSGYSSDESAYLSGSYGTVCMVCAGGSQQALINPLDCNRNNPYRNSLEGLPRRRHYCGEYPSNTDNPVCYYKDCIYGFGVYPNPEPPTIAPQYVTFLDPALLVLDEDEKLELLNTVSNATYFEQISQINADRNIAQNNAVNAPVATFGSPEWKLPTYHGGHCKHAVVDDTDRICNSCQHPYIRWTNSESPMSSANSFQPRLCGEGKCVLFEMKNSNEKLV